jgi:hypothetical protein
MGSPGTAARPLKPRIGLTTLLVRQDGAAPKVTNAFLGHCQATRQAFAKQPATAANSCWQVTENLAMLGVPVAGSIWPAVDRESGDAIVRNALIKGFKRLF